MTSRRSRTGSNVRTASSTSTPSKHTNSLPADFVSPMQDHYKGSICMSGAIPEGGKIQPMRKPELNRLKRTVCRKGPETQLAHQPYRMVNKTELEALELFNNPDTYDCLPNDFLTTHMGLKRARDFIRDQDGEDNDDVIVSALLRVGGEIPKHKRRNRVHYPEEMVPILGSRTEGDSWYWDEIEMQGIVWAIMPRSLWHKK